MSFIKRNKWDLSVILLASILMYYIQSLGWPLKPGRDFGAYVNYYVDMWSSEPYYKFLMASAVKPPVPLFIGAFYRIGGPVLLEIAVALLFSVSILSIYYIGSTWNRQVALISSIAVILYPGYAGIYHELATECFSACGFILWAAFVCYSSKHPSIRNFALHAFFLFLLLMIRQANLILLVFAVFPFLLPNLKLRDKIIRCAIILSLSIAFQMLWSTYNYVRYDVFTIARSNRATTLFRSYCIDRIVKPENGPASAKLADAVKNELLNKEPYKSYGIDLDLVFSTPPEYKNSRIFLDIISLSDRVWGWESNYEVLGQAAKEAIFSYPTIYLKNVMFDIIKVFSGSYESPVHRRFDYKLKESKQPPKLNERGLPVPTESQIIPNSYINTVSTTKEGMIIEEKKIQFENKKKAMGLDIIELPNRDGISDIATGMNYLTRLFPKMDACIILGVILLGFGMPGKKIIEKRTFLFLSGIGIIVVVLSIALAQAVIHYRIPFDPIFIILATSAVIRDGIQNWGFKPPQGRT